MTEFTHKSVSAGYSIEPLKAGDMVETYARSWHERLFSWPWKPWLKTGVRPSFLARAIEARERTLEEMQRITDMGPFIKDAE
jgi:hypothetical protein